MKTTKTRITKAAKYHNKTLRGYRTTASQNTWSREHWVEGVLRIASLKYNLEEEDFVNYANRIRRGK